MPDRLPTDDVVIDPQPPPTRAATANGQNGSPPAAAPPTSGKTPPSEETPERDKAKRQRLVVELTELLLSNGVAGTVLSSRVIEALDARLKTREEQRQKRLAIFLSVGGLLGFGGISVILNSFVDRAVKAESTDLTATMADTIETRFKGLASATDVSTRILVDEVGKTIKADVLAVIGDRVGSEVAAQIRLTTESILEREANLQKLSSLVVLLSRDSDGFTNSLRDAIAALLKRLSADPDIRSRAEFPAILEIVLDKFVAAGLDQHVDTIVGLFEDECLGSSGIVETLIIHYGQRLNGASLPPEEVPDSLVARFNSLETAASSHRLDSVLLPYRILWEFTRGGHVASSVVEHLLSEVEELAEPKRKGSVLVRFIQYRRAAHWVTDGESVGIHMQRHCEAFWLLYAPVLERMRDQPGVQQEMLRVAIGVGEDVPLFGQAVMEFLAAGQPSEDGAPDIPESDR